MRHGEGGGVGHRRVTQQRGIDLRQADLLAAPVDHLAQAPMQVQKTIGIEAADVAGMEPAVAHHVAVERFIAQVAGHDGRAAHADLAALAWRHWLPGFVDDAQGSRPGPAHGARAEFAGERRIDGDLRGLAGAVVLDQWKAEHALEIRDDVLRQRRTTGRGEVRPVLLGVVRARLRRLEDRPVHRRAGGVPARL